MFANFEVDLNDCDWLYEICAQIFCIGLFWLAALLGLLCFVVLQSLTPVQLGLVILSIVCQDREEAVGLYYAANNFMSLTFLSQRVVGHFSCRAIKLMPWGTLAVRSPFPDPSGKRKFCEVSVFGQRA